MIEQLICYLNGILGEANIVSKQYGLAEKVYQSEKSFPAAYNSNGNFEYVNDLSKWLGISYFRKRSEITSTADYNMLIACAAARVFTIPLYFILSVKKGTVMEDNAYHDDNIALYIAKLFTLDNPPFKNELKAFSLIIEYVSHETDRKSVMDQEFEGFAFMPNYEYGYISMSIDVKISINVNCMPDLCGPILVTNEGEPIVTNKRKKIKA